MGRGIPNFRKAYSYLQTERQNRQWSALLEKDWLKAFPSPFTTDCRIIIKAPRTGKAEVALIDITGRTVAKSTLNTLEGTIYTIPFPSLQSLQAGVYTVLYRDGEFNRNIRILKQ
jgi:hypothetical protein